MEAKREDWARDPFQLVEENGNFYARGAVDDKAEAAIWVDTLIRYRAEKYRPLRTLKLALTCGEETAGALNGAQWLTQNRRELIDAAFAINEGASGELDASGKRVLLQVQAGEKLAQNYRLEVTNRVATAHGRSRTTPSTVLPAPSSASSPMSFRHSSRTATALILRYGEDRGCEG